MPKKNVAKNAPMWANQNGTLKLPDMKPIA
jgi:hypothetical protein